MKNIILLGIIMLLVFFGFKEAKEELVAKHDIESITVYLNSAEIHRKATVSISAGKTDVVFTNLSSFIMPSGMKVSVSNGVKVYAVNKEHNSDAWKSNTKVKDIEVEVAALDKEDTQLDIELSTHYKELDYLDANMKMGGNAPASFEQLDRGAEYFSKKIKSIQEKIYTIKEQQEEIQRKRLELNEDLRPTKGRAMKSQGLMRITVISDKAQTCEIDLRYLVSNAVWQPYYSLRAKSKSDPITLEYQAQIYNNTGVDWDNKPMTLAIMDPSEDVSKPQMDAWVLDEAQYYGEGLLSDKKGLYKSGKADANTEFDVLQVDDLSTRFEIKDLHYIPADATPHLIDVTSYTKEASYYNLSIPKVKDGAFLIARIKDWESLGLLDGPMHLYYKDTYQGLSQLNTQQVSDTLDFSLGKEKAFTVTRRKESSMSSKSLFGNVIKEILTYEIIVKNNKPENAEIEIRDQIPISTDKNVEVKALQLSGANLHALSGQLDWKIKLAPNEKKRIILKFSVKYPKSKRGLLQHNTKRVITPRFF